MKWRTRSGTHHVGRARPAIRGPPMIRRVLTGGASAILAIKGETIESDQPGWGCQRAGQEPNRNLTGLGRT